MADDGPVAATDERYGFKAQTAAEEIRRRISNGDFPPGMHLRQDQVAAGLALSRVPVREAFKILVAERVLVHERNRGHYVARLTSSEMADICWLRETLEAELARTAAPATTETLDRLDDLRAQIESLLGDPSNVWRRVDLDLQFHDTLWNLSNRPVLIQDLRLVAERQRPYRVQLSNRVPNRDTGAAHEHQEIVEALRAGDLARYQALLSVHISRARELIGPLRESELAEG